MTEVKRNEERLRLTEQLMVDTQGVAHLGTWQWDVSEPNAHWSAELYRIYGLTPATYTPSYEGYLKMIHPDDRQRVIDATNLVFNEHVPYSHDERIFPTGRNDAVSAHVGVSHPRRRRAATDGSWVCARTSRTAPRPRTRCAA